MTGEMYNIDQDGNDSNGDCWPLHVAIARAVHGVLKPFDVYQGPYIVVGEDVRIGAAPYAIAPRGLGVKRLWIQSEDGEQYTIYREDIDKQSAPFWFDNEETAIQEARALLRKRR